MKRLRFLHIPKCAGTSFFLVLQLQYFWQKRFLFTGLIDSDFERYYALPQNERKKIKVFSGHSPIVTGIPEIDETVQIITILRDPVDRVKSFCQHVSEGKSVDLIDQFPPESFTLDDFLSSGNEEISNLQCKMLLNTKYYKTSEALRNLSFSDAKNLALQNLFHKIYSFGIQEYFDESLLIFQKKLNWSNPYYCIRNVKDRARLIEFKPHHLDKIRELNRLDIEIYQAAKTKFLEMLDTNLNDKERLNRFRNQQKIASPLLQTIISSGSRIKKWKERLLD